MKEKIISHLSAECSWRNTLHWYPSMVSTNTHAKELAASGAPHGTVVIAGMQTGGRGRMGRSFHSPLGMGLYLSVILRPHCPPGSLMHLTCAAGVAACDAVRNATGFQPGIKWINDLVAGNQKLGGILTEMSLDPKSGNVEYAVIGIGINCTHSREDFPPELREIAVSLKTVTGKAPELPLLAACLIHALWETDAVLLNEKDRIMDRYRQRCVTLGQSIVVIQNETRRFGTAIGLDSDGGLTVRFEDGTVSTVNSGEVSIRGMYGYL